MANGSERGVRRGVYVYLDPDQIADIRDWAEETNASSFSDAARTLIEWGFEEAQRHD